MRMLCHDVYILHLVLVSQSMIIKDKFFWVLHDYMQAKYLLCHYIIQHAIHSDVFAQQELDHIHLEHARAQLSSQLYRL